MTEVGQIFQYWKILNSPLNGILALMRRHTLYRILFISCAMEFETRACLTYVLSGRRAA